MKLFSQATLIVAMTVAAGAQAGLTPVSDTALSNATGQDGITVKITPPGGGLSVDHIYVHDKDGVGAPAYSIGTPSAGAITVGNTSIVNDGITLKVDADGNGGAPVLNVNVDMGTSTVNLGAIGVAASNRSVANNTWGIDTTTNKQILNAMTLEMGSAKMNIQLGNQPQGSLIKLSGSITNGLTISNFGLTDPVGTGTIGIDEIALSDVNGTNLTLGADISVTQDGLLVKMGGNNLDAKMSNITLGSAASIGDVEVGGINAVGTEILVSGH